MDKLMIKTSDVDLDLSKYIDFNNVEKYDSELIRVKIMDFKKDLKNCLPCEKMHILQNINDLIYLTYPKIDLSFLKKFNHIISKHEYSRLFNEKPLGLSASAINCYVPVFCLIKNIQRNNSFTVESSYFGGLIVYAGDDENNLSSYYGFPSNRFEYNAKYIYNGIIPIKTKQKIKHAESIGLKDISLIVPTEKKDWNVEIITRDPIVIGFDDNNQARYIDKYDTIPLEEQMLKEYV